MNLKERIRELFNLCQELEEVAVNDDFLNLVKEVLDESDPDEDYNIADCLSFLEDLHYAVSNDMATMQEFYDEY